MRWCGAYLCGTGGGWGVDRFGFRCGKACEEILESFFSRKMKVMRQVLQCVEWDMNQESEHREILSISGLGDDDRVELTGEMSTAYGNLNAYYRVSDTFTVNAYAFEFSNLVSSYPASDDKSVPDEIVGTPNREKMVVGLVHSVLLAKHLGTEKLKAIKRYYDRHLLAEGTILRNAFKLLAQQTNSCISDDSKLWEMLESTDFQIPIFPYRMQMVALWDKSSNQRVLQASARADVENSISNFDIFRVKNKYEQQGLVNAFENEQCVLHNAPHFANIFEYCTEWTIEQMDKKGRYLRKGSLGVVLESVRTFLAEWITGSAQLPNWEPEMPTACVKFDNREIIQDHHYLIWICQRELQRQISEMYMQEQSLPGSAALVMLFILGFPLLEVDNIEDSECDRQETQGKLQEAIALSCSSRQSTIDLSVKVWRVWTCLAPQLLSLIIRHDSDKGIMSLRLENKSGGARFIWQDWVDAAMGCIKGFEEGRDGELGYGRRVVRTQLGNSVVEFSPLFVNKDGIGESSVLERTSTARVWMGWPPFDLQICKFEVDQWLNACKIDLTNWRTGDAIERFEGVIEAIISSYSEEVEALTHCTDDG